MSAFVVRPYVQLGDAPRLGKKESVALVWHARDADMPWRVEVRRSRHEAWGEVRSIGFRRVDLRGSEPHRVYTASVHGLEPGDVFEYRVSTGDAESFTGTARARKSADQSLRFVVMGDLGQGRPEQAAVSCLVGRADPDFVFVPGDFVYHEGTVPEYRKNFFPFYNSPKTSPESGSSVMSSSIFLGGLGEHDWGSHDAKGRLDLLGYFIYWHFPMNGPPARTYRRSDGRKRFPFSRFPFMANYSFDFGNSHWTVLDSWNPHADWTDRRLRRWLRDDLRSASKTTWKFVGCYLSPFLTSKSYPGIQKMRVVADIFQDCKVDVVFSGYAHCYQRSRPLKFQAKRVEHARHYNTLVGGRFELDTEFDGVRNTTPRWPLYVVSSGGGASLHDPEQTEDPSSWEPFTAKYVSNRNSFTLVDVSGKKLSFTQIASDGCILDKTLLTK